jgi:hypothetical protein
MTFARKPNPWALASLIVVSVACLSARAQNISIYSSWLSQREYQRQFDQHVAKKFYPMLVEGRNEGGVRQYRARFVPYPDGIFNFESRSEMSVEGFNRRNDELLVLGYTLIHEQRFTDTQGTAVQAVWTRLGTTQTTPIPGLEEQPSTQRF